MFQRFKNALDQLEEQARKPTPSVPPRNAQQRRVQSIAAQRNPRASSDAPTFSSGDLATPDLDPSTFDPESDAGNDTVDKDSSSAVQSDQQTAGKDDEPDRSSDPPPNNGEVSTVQESASPIVEKEDRAPVLPDDVQLKLRKLTRLESKYQDLLKAYRKAHARNSIIEPFENKLREVTPLTSISDPDAFAELMNQMTQRTGMVIDELKRVTTDRDALKNQLEEARQDTTKAYDEVARLQEKAATKVSGEGSVLNTSSSPKGVENISEFETSGQTEITNPSQLGTNTPVVPESQDDLFSVDNEVPRLEADLASKQERIALLEKENESLERDLRSARESAQEMIQNLETTSSQLDSLKHERAKAERELNEAKTASNLELAKARVALREAEAKLSQSNAQHLAALEAKDKELSARSQDVESIKSDMRNGEQRSKPLPDEMDTEQNSTGESRSNDSTTNGADLKLAQLRSAQQGSSNIDSQAQVNNLSGKKAKKKLEECLKELDEKKAIIDKLHAKLREQEDLVSEIETLRGDLSDIGSEHVDVKHELKMLKEEKAELERQVQALEKQSEKEHPESEARDVEGHDESISALQKQLLDEAAAHKNSISTNETERARLQDEIVQLQEKVKMHEKDLEASQSLASTRFKEVQALKERIQKIQPELGALRTEVKDLRNAKKDLGTATAETKKLEARSQNLRAEIESFKKRLADKDNEIRVLNEKVSNESSRRIDLEETSRKSQRELERLSAERNDAASARDALQDRHSATDKDLRTFRERAQRFESDLNNVRREASGLREELELKSAQQASAQSLMNSVRDQASEMAVQMKETQQRYDSLEEELADAHRLMNERSREGETMRRLINDVEARAETRIKEMKERMEVAVQERDRAEEESSQLGRRRAREVEELRKKAREAERELKAAIEAKSELADAESELRRGHEEDTRKVAQAMQEMQDMKRAMGELRDTLDEGERQSRELEEERNSSKEALEEALGRIEKLQKTNKSVSDELRSLRANRIKPSDSPSRRSSLDGGSRLQSPISAGRAISRTSSTSGPASVANGSIDYVYLKNILLQFLEQKDRKNQMQLVPVLGKILHFDKADEQRWSKAVNTR